jgi:hypothetical protein
MLLRRQPEIAPEDLYIEVVTDALADDALVSGIAPSTPPCRQQLE